MTKQKPLVIDKWETGVNINPYSGFSTMVGVNNSKGTVKMNLSSFSSTTTTGCPKYFTYDGIYIYTITDSGYIYYYNNSSWINVGGCPITITYGTGIKYFNGRIFVSNGSQIAMYNPGGSSWYVTTFNLSTNSNYTPMTICEDNILYIGNGNIVASINASFTFTAVALTLPTEYTITSLVELGDQLYGGMLNITRTKSDIFSWDRTLTSSFLLPIRINDSGIYQMVVKNNLLYFLSGGLGNFYESNGSTATKIGSIGDLMRPVDTTSNDYFFFQQNPSTLNIGFSPGGMTILNEKILIGLTIQSTTGGHSGYYPFGVWSYNTDLKTWRIENILPTGDSQQTNKTLEVGGIIKFSDYQYMFGYRKDFTGTPTSGVALTTGYSSDYSSYFESAIYEIGTEFIPKTFQNIEIKLTKPLVLGQGIQLKYRNRPTDDWILIKTIDFTTFGGIKKTSVPFAGSGDYIQIRGEFSGGALTPELIEVRLI